MKIAFLFYGRIKKFDKFYMKNIVPLKEHTIDCFLSHSPELNEDLAEFISLYKPISYTNVQITEEDIFKEPVRIFMKQLGSYNSRTIPNSNNMKSHFINKRRVFQLLENHVNETNTTYDYIIVTRLDLTIYDTLNLQDIHISENTIYIPEGHDYEGLNDRLCIGNMNSIKKYCDIFNNSPNLLIAGCEPYPENLLLAHVKSKGLEVKRFKLASDVLVPIRAGT
jgi:hypothetical protein